MKVASWNVNSIRSRITNVLDWISREKPEIFCIQETKVVNESFPKDVLEDIGYNFVISGQKSYNGVATFSKFIIEEKVIGLPGFDDDQARYIETIHSIGKNVLRVINIYLPNGNPYPGDKYNYKIEWMKALKNHLTSLNIKDEALILLGDFNIIPEEIDVYNPEKWKNDALFLLDTRKQFRELLSLGLTDIFRSFYPEKESYTFWDYQRGAWQKNEGIRIDHVLASPIAADLINDIKIDKEERNKEKPSDHVPIIAEILNF